MQRLSMLKDLFLINMKMGKINFSSLNTSFTLKSKTVLRDWILSVIKKESHFPGTITYNFCDDKTLLAMNKQYLNHDTYTDILTFDYGAPFSPGRRAGDEGFVSWGKVLPSPTPPPFGGGREGVSGDIFISIDRIKENANKFNVNFENELHRVMIHGILHLCGYKDKKKTEKELMRKKEDIYLKQLEKT